ncbi:MAG: hypothetical protein HY881_26080 [Deltaproteobacteria bacterium]|nr:hypothetical protein [Deltaproteobacteria bacterium]
MADNRTLLTTRIILNAILPVMKVVVSDDPKMNKKFKGVNARIQFVAGNDGDRYGAALVFTDGKLAVEQGVFDSADILFSFSTLWKFNDFLCGKTVIPKISGILKLGLFIKVVLLLLAMKLMMPAARPTDAARKRLKVKMIIYMITTALSQYNKGGDPEMTAWTEKQPDRIYQISVAGEDDIAGYVRIKAGKSKAGRGIYKRRRPFVHIRFSSVDSALPVLLNDTEFVSALAKNLVTVEGSPEYGSKLNDFMQRIQALLV